MRRANALLAALAAAACSRNLDVPSTSPPRIDTIQLAGLDPSAAPAPLPVLGGELVALTGGGFPSSASLLSVTVGNDVAEVVDVAPDRIVLQVPALAAAGPADLTLQTASGLLTRTGALRYDGPGQPLGLGSTDLASNTLVGLVTPVQGFASRFPPFAVATGASDAALLVVPALNAAVTTVPLGVVPTSAASRIVPAGPNFQVQVLAVDRAGNFAVGATVIDPTFAVVSRLAPAPLAHPALNPKACSGTQLLVTPAGQPVVAWTAAGDVPRIAAVDLAQLATGVLAPTGSRTLPAPLVGWSPWSASSIVVATAADLLVYDAAALTTTTLAVPAGGGPPRRVLDLVAAACPPGGPVTLVRNVAVASWNGSDALALSYVAGGVDRVALVDLGPGPTSGAVRTGLLGTFPTALALAPVPAFDPGGAGSALAVLAAGISTLLRASPAPAAPACEDLVPDAALALSPQAGLSPPFGGMAVTADGTRLLAVTPDGDLWNVLPPTLTSAGPVVRLASYAGLSLQPARIGETSIPAIVAEHARYDATGLSNVETGAALLFVSLDADGGGVALGGSGYARGAVWLDAAVGGVLAYTGDLPGTSLSAGSVSGGAASVAGFDAGACPGEGVRVTGSRPVLHGPDLVTQGPARAGALGPAGVARQGPASTPFYAVVTAGTTPTLVTYGDDPGTLACLGGAGTPDWDPAGACTPAATEALPVAPLDVTFSAGDRVAALRSLAASSCAASCAPGDALCERASCPPSRQLDLVRPGSAGSSLTLPAAVRAVAPHPAGGFLVTLRCASPPASGPLACFPSSALCDGVEPPAGSANGALVYVPEDGASPACLAVLPALGGALAVTPNGAEAWVTGSAGGTQLLTRLSLPRRASDARIDAGQLAKRLSVEALGAAAVASGSFPTGGVAFTPDGSTGVVTVPAAFRIVLYQ